MFESLAALAVRRPVAVSVVALAVALVGWLSWQQLPVDLLPDVETPTVVVSVRSGDRPPAEMERLYGERVEQLLFSVRGIRNVEQVARSGRLVATVEFDWESDIDLGLIDVQKAVGRIEADPEVDEVLVRRFDPRQAPILSLGLVAPSGKPDLAELRRLARRQVAPGLERLPGVAEVRVVGGREREVRITVDRYRLDAYGVSLSQLERRLAQENVDIAAGTLEEENRIFQLRALSRFRRIEDVGNVVVRYLPDDSGRQKAVRVSDIGSIELIDREIDHLVRVDGAEGVGLSIYKEAGANTVAVSTTVRDALGGLDDDLPNVDVREITDDASVVVDALDHLKTAAGVGVVLAIAVLAVFLRSAGAVLIVAAAVPVSLFAALFFMGFESYSLNIVTLGGLALGAGMLVDNAIVVVESIYRRLTAGDAPGPAAARGTGEVAGAITASTLTTLRRFSTGAVRAGSRRPPDRWHRVYRDHLPGRVARRGAIPDPRVEPLVSAQPPPRSTAVERASRARIVRRQTVATPVHGHSGCRDRRARSDSGIASTRYRVDAARRPAPVFDSARGPVVAAR